MTPLSLVPYKESSDKVVELRVEAYYIPKGVHSMISVVEPLPANPFKRDSRDVVVLEEVKRRFCSLPPPDPL